MRRIPSPIALPLAAIALVAASITLTPAPDVAAQATPAPKPAATAVPAAKPAGSATTAPRAGGIPLEMAAALVGGGSAAIVGGVYALRRRKGSAS